MKPAKLVALVMFLLGIIPAAIVAAPNYDDSCQDIGKHTCVNYQGKFIIARCASTSGGTESWSSGDFLVTYGVQFSCDERCRYDYGSNCIISPASTDANAIGTLTVGITPQNPVTGQTITITSTSNGVQTIQSHTVSWKVYRGGTLVASGSSPCSTSFSSCTISVAGSQSKTQNGDIFQYWSDLSTGSTGLRAPANGENSIIIGTASISGDDNACTNAGGTCTTITSGINTGEYFMTGKCSGPADRICKFTQNSIHGCQSCVTGNRKWCYSDSSGYCSSDNCIDGYTALADPSKCSGVLGDESTTGTPASPGGTAGSATVVISPSTPAANSRFVVTFDLSNPLQSGQSLAYRFLCGGTLVRGSISISDCSGRACYKEVSGGVPAPSCVLTASINNQPLTFTNSNVDGEPDEFSLTVSSSAQTGTGPTSGSKCCVTSYGLQRTYSSIPSAISDDACESEGGASYSYACDSPQMQSIVCQTFCGTQFSTTGTCQWLGSQNRQPASNQYKDVCRNGQLCQCGGMNGQTAQYDVECTQACYTATYGSGVYTPYYSSQQATVFPVGQCTDNPQAFISSWMIGSGATQTGGSIVQQPRILSGAPGSNGRGYYQCQPNDYCVCTYLNFNAFTANINRPSAPVLPGTTPWNDPENIADTAPSAVPNDRICDTAAANATITATLSMGTGAISNSNLKLIQAGDTVTITGSVGKLADTCKGYTYTCRRERVVGCDMKKRGLWTTLDYKDCPAALPEIVHEEGGGRDWNWEAFAGAGVIAAGILTPCDGLCITMGISLVIGGVQREASCKNGQTGPSVAPFVYNTLNSVSNGNQPNTPVPWGQPNNQPAYSGCSEGTCQGSCSSGTTSSHVQCSLSNGGTGTCCVSATTSGTNQDDCHASCGYSFGSCNDNCASEGNSDDPACYEFCNTEYDRCRTGCGSLTGGAAAKPTIDVTGKNVLPARQTVPSYGNLPGATAGAGRVGSFMSSPYAAELVYTLGNTLPAACPTLEEQSECFRVCGKTYETNASRAPVCNGPVIGYKEAAYKCGQGLCGGFASKSVRVQIKDPSGAVVVDDITTTDANGEFSYTFNAPAADGEFSAVVSVPKG